MNMKIRYTIGAEITSVSKGIQRSEYSKATWIDERQKGRTSFFKIEKIGTTYLYGRYIRFEDDLKELCYYESRINPEDYIILNGIRHDMKLAHTDFISQLDQHKEAEDKQRRELEYKASQHVNNQMDTWRTEHPRPKLQNGVS